MGASEDVASLAAMVAMAAAARMMPMAGLEDRAARVAEGEMAGAEATQAT
jgi:hypothetical protein